MTESIKLPRGRHKLSRDEVVRSQRDRILLAMAEAMAEKGYVATSVADVLRRAGVSRETFYQQFTSKEDCFRAAYGRAVESLLARIVGDGLVTGQAQSAGPVEPARLEQLLGAYLDGLADEPAFAKLFLIEVYAAGSEVLRRRVELQDGFVDLIAGVLGARSDEQRFACQTLAAAISSLVTARLAMGDLDGLRALRKPLVDMVRRSGAVYGESLVLDARS